MNAPLSWQPAVLCALHGLQALEGQLSSARQDLEQSREELGRLRSEAEAAASVEGHAQVGGGWWAEVGWGRVR